MIKKLIHIKNCGKFSDFDVKSNSDWNGIFEDINTIYAENGFGKTTLTQIFKSLRGDTSELSQKKDIFSNNDIEISMIVNKSDKAYQYNFKDEKWNNDVLDVEVFDHYYSEDNEYVMDMGNLIFINEHIQKIDNKNININRTIEILKHKIGERNSELRKVNLLMTNTKPEERLRLNARKNIIKLEKSKIQKNLDFYVDRIKKNTISAQKYADYRGSQYVEFVNYYLRLFNANYIIEKLNFNNKTKKCIFDLMLNDGTAIRKDGSTNRSLAHFLSEGDKTAISLSFFMAYINSLPNLDSRIIVLDDPFASFDTKRKATTIKCLKEVAEKCKQFFLLSHDLYFIKDFYKENINRPSLNLRITKRGGTNCIVKQDTTIVSMSQVRKDIELLRNFLNKGAANEFEQKSIASNLRNVLEGLVRIKYYDIVEDGMLGPALEEIEKHKDDFPIKKHMLELRIVNDYSCKYHHTNPNYLTEPIYDDELISMVEKTLRLIHYI